MRCAYSNTTCPADADLPGRTGGDIVAVVETHAATRVLIGDAMGHGPRAWETAAEVGRAFRRLAAHDEDPPQVIAARLDLFVAERKQGGDPGGAAKQRRPEEFVTAQFIDVPRGRTGAQPWIVNCGHPTPLVLSGGRVSPRNAVPAVPPLGLLGLAEKTYPRACPLVARAGDMVLLYTDGVTEARDSRGTPYPFVGRLKTITRNLDPTAGESPGDTLLEAIKTDLLAHADGPLRDDATLMSLLLSDDSQATRAPRPLPAARSHPTWPGQSR